MFLQKSLFDIVFCFLGSVADKILNSKAESIFMAANFYEMMGLKIKTERALIKQINTENMLNRFLMADMHGAIELRLVAKNLMICNSEALVNDKDWKKTISKSHDESLVYEILEGIALAGRLNKSKKRKRDYN